MSPTILLFSILAFDFFIRTLIFFLNRTRLHYPLATIADSNFNYSSYRSQQLYQSALLTLEWVKQLVVFLATLILILIDFPDWLDHQIRNLPLSSFPRGVVFFALLGILLQTLKLPTELLKIFRLDRRYNIIISPKSYALEITLKGFVALVLGSTAYALLLVSYGWLNERFWYMSWFLFSIVFLVYALLNQRISFYFSSGRTVSVSDSLRRQLRSLLKDFRMSVKDILVQKQNNTGGFNAASLALWGSRGKIILNEQVFARLNEEEIKAIIVHEAAHYKRYHIFNQILTTVLQIGILLLLLGVTMQTVYFQQALGASRYSIYMGLLSFVLLFSPASLLINLLVNSLNRYFENKADLEVIKAGLSKALASALLKLASEKPVNFTPHPLFEIFYDQHPGLLKRIIKLRENDGSGFSANICNNTSQET